MNRIPGPYRINPEFDACIQTADGERDIAMIMPDFSFNTGVTEPEHIGTLSILAASWDLLQLLKETRVQGVLSEELANRIDAKIKELENV